MPLSKLKIKKATNTDTSRPDASAVAAEKRETDKNEMVMKRLRKAKHLEVSPEQLEELALTLCNEERMKEKYFKYLSQFTLEAVEEVKKERTCHRGGIRNTQQQATCMRVIHQEVHRVKSLEVKLAFRTLRNSRWQRVAQLIHKYVKNFEYGAFHAAVIIGDTVLEWDDSSLVIPRRFSETDWVFWSSVHVRETEDGITPVPVRATDQQTSKHFEYIEEKIEGIRKEKELLIKALVEMAVIYNTKLHYGIISNNCQHFVKDCLSAIGKSSKENFEGKVGELAELLVKGGALNTVPGDFATHEELNTHVKSNLEQMTVEDMEYCICLYHLFHAFEQEEDDTECSDKTCQEKNLEGALERKKTPIS